MLVYGGGRRDEPAAVLLTRLHETLAEVAALDGLARHAALVGALIEAGCLAQGLADHGFAARGEVDGPDPAAASALALARALATATMRSWDTGFRTDAAEVGTEIRDALAGMAAIALPADPLAIREPEGFAHYAVYPEAFAVAARALPPGPVCVIGLRSIGTALAAAACAGLAQVSGLVTLRPSGPPFRRVVRVDAGLRAHLAARAHERFAVVDEGPGLSGSSVAAVLRLLEEIGIAPGRIHVLTSHAGPPGPEADDSIRALWARTARHAVTFDDLVLTAPDPAHRFASWCREAVGPLTRSPVEMSGGGWRRERGWPEESGPPAHPWAEARKFLLRTEAGEWVAKFAGLGRIGTEKLALARRLHAAGFVPEPLGLVHGFLLERWHREARSPDPVVGRARTLARLGEYLAVRAGLVPPPGQVGADLPALFATLRVNAAEGLGDAAEAAAARWAPRLAALAAASRPVLSDGRLHAWEWLAMGSAPLLKADALDHHRGHDLVGPQDIAWDLAGAAAEFDLTAEEERGLAAAIEAATGRTVDPALAAFLREVYLAFWLGASAMASAASGDPRLAAEVERYRAALGARLSAAPGWGRGGPGLPEAG